MTIPPRAACAVALMAGLTLVALGDGAIGSGALVDHPLTLLLAAVIGFLLGTWVPTSFAAFGVLALGAALTYSSQRHFSGDYPLINDLVFFLLVVGAPAVAGATLVAGRTQIRELAALSERLTRQRADELTAACLEEQRRIEGAVHHRLIQQLGAIALRAEGARQESDPALRDQAIVEVEEAARAGLVELRSALGVLRAEPEPTTAPESSVPEPDPPAWAPPGPIGWPDVLLAVSVGVALAVESVISSSARGPAWLNVAVSLAIALPLVWRRRNPIAAMATALLLSVAASSTLTPASSMVTALAIPLILGFSVGAYASGRRRAVGALVLTLGLVGLALVTPAGSRHPDSLLPTILWGLLAVGAGVPIARASTRTLRLQRVVEALERSRDADLKVAVARQRQKMSRDLHDTVAHTLTVVCLGSGAARHGGSPTEALATIARTAREGMGELRRGLDALETGDLQDATARSVARALGVELHLVATGTLGIPETALLHRVLREALVNVARYAPGARVEAQFVRVAGGVCLIVTDEGAPTAPPDRLGTGSGLSGLAGLVREHGGVLEYGPLPRGGFRVETTVPITVEAPR